MEKNANGLRMKVQLPLENWVDLFGLVPRRQLAKLLPQIDDRHFAEALQYFLQKVGKITLEYLLIVPPERNDTNGRPMVDKGWEKLDLADTQMPENIKNFGLIHLSYLDISVVNFLRHFQQNSLLQNVNILLLDTSNEILLPFLTHVLPLIDSIESIRMWGIPELGQIGDSPPPAENNNEFNQSLLNSMMAQPRILQISKEYSDLEPYELDWCCNWLYNTPRNDGRPRLLIFSEIYSPNGISSIVDRIKKDFVIANHPISFFVTIYVYDSTDTFQWPHQDISHENGRTNEKMVVRKVQTTAGSQMLISRHPHEASKQWIEQNEKEILDFDFPFNSKTFKFFRLPLHFLVHFHNFCHLLSQICNHETARYAEYNNTGPGAGTAGRVSWSRQLNATEAAELVPSVIFGADWDPTKVLLENSECFAGRLLLICAFGLFWWTNGQENEEENDGNGKKIRKRFFSC